MQNFTFKKLAYSRPNLRFIRRFGYLLLSLACILLLSLIVPQTQPQLASLMTSKAVAQVVTGGPTGIIGGVPPSLRGTVRYAQLRQNDGAIVTIPINGIGNYVLYYTPVVNQSVNPNTDTFIPSGTYEVVYLDGSGNVLTDPTGCSPACIVTYSPTTDYTQSVQVPTQPINPPPSGVTAGPLGIYGVVTNATTGLPIPNASVFLFTDNANNEAIDSLQTNGNGFFSFYYTGTGIKGFVPPGFYSVFVDVDGFVEQSFKINYIPQQISSPASDGYYVSNAALERNFSLTPNS